MTFPIEKVRADFPILTREVNGLPLAYLDSAASAQKPNQVIDAESDPTQGPLSQRAFFLCHMGNPHSPSRLLLSDKNCLPSNAANESRLCHRPVNVNAWLFAGVCRQRRACH